MIHKVRMGSSVKKAPAQYFTGRVTMHEIRKAGPDVHDMYHVTFHGGARTQLHAHAGRQVLIVTEGTGSLITYKKTGMSRATKSGTTKLSKGDVVAIPARTLHTHGATGKKTLSHIALNGYHGGRSPVTTWYGMERDGRFAKI